MLLLLVIYLTGYGVYSIIRPQYDCISRMNSNLLLSFYQIHGLMLAIFLLLCIEFSSICRGHPCRVRITWIHWDRVKHHNTMWIYHGTYWTHAKAECNSLHRMFNMYICIYLDYTRTITVTSYDRREVSFCRHFAVYSKGLIRQKMKTPS